MFALSVNKKNWASEQRTTHLSTVSVTLSTVEDTLTCEATDDLNRKRSVFSFVPRVCMVRGSPCSVCSTRELRAHRRRGPSGCSWSSVCAPIDRGARSGRRTLGRCILTRWCRHYGACEGPDISVDRHRGLVARIAVSPFAEFTYARRMLRAQPPQYLSPPVPEEPQVEPGFGGWSHWVGPLQR